MQEKWGHAGVDKKLLVRLIVCVEKHEKKCDFVEQKAN